MFKMKDVLITFGCSWTFGQGSAYKEGMTEDEYDEIYLDKDLCWENGWRRQVVEHFDFDHINFGLGGSSNDKQFRLAQKFFVSKRFKEIYQQNRKIYVLWGTTSVNRYDFWIKQNYQYEHIFLKHSDGQDVHPDLFQENSEPIDHIAACLTKYSYYEPARVKELELQFLHWNQYFKLLGIKNFWYDTFSSFNYSVDLPNFFDLKKRRRDLLSVLVENHRKKVKSKIPVWHIDDFVYARDNNLLNPYTYHPKTDGYKQLGDHMIKKLQEHI